MKATRNKAETGMDQFIAGLSTPLNNTDDLDPLLEYIDDARFVLLGESSHGTHEYYTWRAKLTRRLILEKGFSLVAVDGDSADCYLLNRYVKNYPDSGSSAVEVLQGFRHWPAWMWANWEMAAFAEWMKKHNAYRNADKRVGFYGLDVYSLWESLEVIRAWLKQHDPKSLEKTLKAMQCFEPYHSDSCFAYGHTTRVVPDRFEQEILNILMEKRTNNIRYYSDHENMFSTEQQAWIDANAERYYRAMLRGGHQSWNIRDKQMVASLNRLMDFHGSNSKVVIWAHNAHIGDARATDMFREGLLNLGQMVTDQHARDGVVLVGFGSYQGSVITGKGWGDGMEKVIVPPAQTGSWEEMLHNSIRGNNQNMLLLLHQQHSRERLGMHLGQRSVGVVYDPASEKFSDYVPGILPMRYDAFIFLDQTKALYPLTMQTGSQTAPDDFPFGL
ncbi:MAG: erythromycin esterase family protein [Bacteroidia bacterium]